MSVCVCNCMDVFSQMMEENIWKREKEKERKEEKEKEKNLEWKSEHCHQLSVCCSLQLCTIAVFFAFCMVQFTSGSKKILGPCLMSESIQIIPLGICPFFHFWPILPFHQLLPGFKNDGMHSFFAVILASHLEKLFACIFLPNCPRMFWLLVVHDCKIANRSTRVSSWHISLSSWPFQTWASDSDCSRPFLHWFWLLENIQQGIGHFSADSFLWARKGSYCKAIVTWKHVALLDVSWGKKSDHAEAGIVKVLLVLWLWLAVWLAAANCLCRFSHRLNVCSWGSIIELTQKFSGTGSNLCSIQHRCARHRKANAGSRWRCRRHLIWQASKLSHKPLNCRA